MPALPTRRLLNRSRAQVPALQMRDGHVYTPKTQCMYTYKNVTHVYINPTWQCKNRRAGIYARVNMMTQFHHASMPHAHHHTRASIHARVAIFTPRITLMTHTRAGQKHHKTTPLRPTKPQIITSQIPTSTTLHSHGDKFFPTNAASAKPLAGTSARPTNSCRHKCLPQPRHLHAAR